MATNSSNRSGWTPAAREAAVAARRQRARGPLSESRPLSRQALNEAHPAFGKAKYSTPQPSVAKARGGINGQGVRGEAISMGGFPGGTSQNVIPDYISGRKRTPTGKVRIGTEQ